jgi:hypothetical protein
MGSPNDLPTMQAAVRRYYITFFVYPTRSSTLLRHTTTHNGQMNVAGVGGVTQSDSNEYRSINRSFDRSSGVARGLVVGKLIAHSSWSRYVYAPLRESD